MAKRPQAPSPPSVLDDLLCFLVYSTGFAFNRVYRKPLEHLGLTYPQFLVMVVLWAEDGLSVGRIGELLKLDSATLTPLLKRLEAQGLVSRRRPPEDERRVLVKLTDHGHALHKRAADVMTCVAGAVDLEADTLSSLLQQMRALREHLEDATV